MIDVDLGQYGAWRRAGELELGFAEELEKIGYPTLWIGGSPPGDLKVVEDVLDSTERLKVATGIVNIWREEASTVAASFHRIVSRHPDRFILGIGVGHPEAVSGYTRPYDKIVAYLDELESAGVPSGSLVLAALGPRVMRLAGQRTAGAHPYLTTPAHTRQAREILGDGPFLAPEQKVILEPDPVAARELGRSSVAHYLRLVNYRNSLLREGWDPGDLDDGGSDRLVDALALHGSIEEIAAGLVAHREAGADHVAIQALGDDPLSTLRALAEPLGVSTRST